MSYLSEVTSCEVCGNKDLKPVLNLGSHPLCDDLIPIGDIRVCPEYPIEILFCSACVTAHQRFQVPKQELFPRTYHNRSRFTADVLNGMSNLVDSCDKRLSGLSGKIVLDIGCNDGSLLDFFRAKGCVTIGIEPTDAYIDAEKKDHTLYNCFLSEQVAETIVRRHGSPDIITFTNVFAHIENLGEVLASLRKLISDSTLIVIENHYLGSILDGSQFDTFYHEHPRTYSYSSFVEISRELGTALQGVEFPSRYGGNIRVFLGNSRPALDGANAAGHVLAEEARYLQKFETLRNTIQKWRLSKRNAISELVKRNGRLAAKAFPGRAAILIKLLGVDENVISSVFEKPGSMKIGHYVPGTRIPIVSDEELFLDKGKPRVILNLAWHIPTEIRSYLKDHGFRGEIIDIISAEEFSERV